MVSRCEQLAASGTVQRHMRDSTVPTWDGCHVALTQPRFYSVMDYVATLRAACSSPASAFWWFNHSLRSQLVVHFATWLRGRHYPSRMLCRSRSGPQKPVPESGRVMRRSKDCQWIQSGQTGTPAKPWSFTMVVCSPCSSRLHRAVSAVRLESGIGG